MFLGFSKCFTQFLRNVGLYSSTFLKSLYNELICQFAKSLN